MRLCMHAAVCAVGGRGVQRVDAHAGALGRGDSLAAHGVGAASGAGSFWLPADGEPQCRMIQENANPLKSSRSIER